MGPRPQCYIPSHKVIGPLVLEKIFEGFLPYMGMAAILVMLPRPREQTFVPPSHWGLTWSLASIGPAVLEKIFENGGRTDNRQRRKEHAYSISSPMSLSSGELKNNSTTKLKKKRKRKQNWLSWGHGWGPILRPLACVAETKPLRHCNKNNFLFQILPTSFQKNQKN